MTLSDGEMFHFAKIGSILVVIYIIEYNKTHMAGQSIWPSTIKK